MFWAPAKPPYARASSEHVKFCATDSQIYGTANMNLDDKNRIADQWLDAAIKQYASPEPDSGLEERIRRNLRTSVPEKKTGWQWWTPWVVATATALLVGGILIHKPHRDDNHAAVKNTSVPITAAQSQAASLALPVVTSSARAEK